MQSSTTTQHEGFCILLVCKGGRGEDAIGGAGSVHFTANGGVRNEERSALARGIEGDRLHRESRAAHRAGGRQAARSLPLASRMSDCASIYLNNNEGVYPEFSRVNSRRNPPKWTVAFDYSGVEKAQSQQHRRMEWMQPRLEGGREGEAGSMHEEEGRSQSGGGAGKWKLQQGNFFEDALSFSRLRTDVNRERGDIFCVTRTLAGGRTLWSDGERDRHTCACTTALCRS